MSETTAQKALNATTQALSGIDEELERHAAGQGRVSSAKQLASIREQLTQMAQQLSSSQLPPKAQRLRGAGHVVADSWPYDSSLGVVILEAEQLYLKA
ncbi:hypothetical protein [Streptomyces sp. NPDC048415]|uniref:hypothetical protein n=1 Tax=unclassified Streptomyces TaxID=2593676 RepID=UPI0034198F0F